MNRPCLALLVLASSFTLSAEAQGLLDRLKREAAEELEERLRSRDRDSDAEAPAAPTPTVSSPAAAPAVPAAGASAESKWRTNGPGGALTARTAGDSIELTIGAGRAVVRRAADGSYTGTAYGVSAPCAAPQDGESSWGSLRILAPSPMMFMAVLAPCAPLGAGSATENFTGTLVSGQSAFMTLGGTQAGNPSVAAVPVAAAAPDRGAPSAAGTRAAATTSALAAEARNLANECATAAAAQPDRDSDAAGIARNCNTACTSIGDRLGEITDGANRDGMMDLCRGAHANVFGLAPPASIVAARDNRGARSIGPPPPDAGDANSVIHRERFYRLYRSRGATWCSDAASFDLIYVQGAVLATDYQRGVGSEVDRKILAVKNAGCPAATRFRLNVVPGNRDAAVEQEYTFRHEFDTFEGNGTTFTGNDRLVPDPPLPRFDNPSVVPQFRGYNLASLFGRIYELKPGMVSRGDFRTSTLFTLYINLFADRCASALPPDKATFVHRERQLVHTQYGFIQTTRYYQDVITGTTDMRPEYIGTYAEAFNYTGQRLIGEFMNNVYDGSDDAVGKVVGELGEFQAAAEPDLERLLAEQGCTSAFTRQFERNLQTAVADAPPPALNELALVNNEPVYFASQDFSPPIPKLAEPAGGFRVTVDKERNGKTLRQVAASRLIGSLPWARVPGLPPEHVAIVDEDITAIWKDGGALLQCTYEAAIELYWLNDRVPSADPEKLRGRLATHPLLAVGAPRDRCPPIATR
jgi:hypothetical protein